MREQVRWQACQPAQYNTPVVKVVVAKKVHVHVAARGTARFSLESLPVLFEAVLVYDLRLVRSTFSQVLVCRVCTVCVHFHACCLFQREATKLTLSLRHVFTSNRAFELPAATSTTSPFSNPVTSDPSLALIVRRATVRSPEPHSPPVASL